MSHISNEFWTQENSLAAQTPLRGNGESKRHRSFNQICSTQPTINSVAECALSERRCLHPHSETWGLFKKLSVFGEDTTRCSGHREIWRSFVCEKACVHSCSRTRRLHEGLSPCGPIAASEKKVFQNEDAVNWGANDKDFGHFSSWSHTCKIFCTPCFANGNEMQPESQEVSRSGHQNLGCFFPHEQPCWKCHPKSCERGAIHTDISPAKHSWAGTVPARDKLAYTPVLFTKIRNTQNGKWKMWQFLAFSFWDLVSKHSFWVAHSSLFRIVCTIFERVRRSCAWWANKMRVSFVNTEWRTTPAWE